MSDRIADQEKLLPDEKTNDAPAAAGAPRHPFAPARAPRWLGVSFRLFILLLVAALIEFVAYEWDWWVGSAVLQSTDDAYLRADLTPLAAKVPGYVRQVAVGDFQKVKAGDLLVEIVDDDYRAELNQAQANVAASEAAIQSIEQQKVLQQALVQQAEATIQGAEADVTRYHLEAARQQTLLAGGIAGTRQLVEQAVDNEKRARATLDLNRAQLEQQRQQINVLDSQAKQANATLGAQKAARDLANINLGYTRIVSPVDGMVGERQVLPGQYLSVGTQVISVVPLPNVWVVANYKETQMTNVRIGQKARITPRDQRGNKGNGRRRAGWRPESAPWRFAARRSRIPAYRESAAAPGAEGRVSMVAITDIPGRSRSPSTGSGSSVILTGMRCTTLVKLPVALSGGSRANCAPEAGDQLSTRPCSTAPGKASTATSSGHRRPPLDRHTRGAFGLAHIDAR